MNTEHGTPPKTEWNKISMDDKFPIILAAIILIFTFFPWASASWDYGYGYKGGYSYNGLHRFGILTFLGSIAFLLWRLLPMFNIKIPDLKMPDKTIEKIIAGVVLAGPVIWMIDSSFEFKYFGIGLWVDLILSAGFAYLLLTGKKFSEIKKKIQKDEHKPQQ